MNFRNACTQYGSIQDRLLVYDKNDEMEELDNDLVKLLIKHVAFDKRQLYNKQFNRQYYFLRLPTLGIVLINKSTLSDATPHSSFFTHTQQCVKKLRWDVAYASGRLTGKQALCAL